MIIDRPEVRPVDVQWALARVTSKWNFRLMSEEKGKGIYVSNHEALGIMLEEWDEIVDDIRKDDIDDEVVDLIVAGLHHLASRRRVTTPRTSK